MRLLALSAALLAAAASAQPTPAAALDSAFADVARFADMVGTAPRAVPRPPNLRTVAYDDVSFTYAHWDAPELRCRLTHTPEWDRVAQATCDVAAPSTEGAQAILAQTLAAMERAWGDRYLGRGVYAQASGGCVRVSRGVGEGPAGAFASITMRPAPCPVGR